MSKVAEQVERQIANGKPTKPFTFVNKVIIDSVGQSFITSVIPTQGDFLVTDVKITGYTSTGSLIDINGIDDLFTLQIRNNASGQSPFNGGVDVSNFAPVLTSDKVRINPFLIGKNENYEFEIKHEDITGLFVAPMKVTFQLVVEGIYLLN